MSRIDYKFTLFPQTLSHSPCRVYTYNRLDSVICPETPINNVYYTYGSPTATRGLRGRIILLEDASGYQTFFYGKMGEVTENIHTFALPNETQPYTFKMKYCYDSWNRVQNITYPDGEVVKYWYDRGGMLRRMDGRKGTQSFRYIDEIHYNRYGMKDAQWYGNGTHVKYSYDTLLRLSLLESWDVLGMMQEVSYSYDKAGNITGIQNSAGMAASGLGGAYTMSYAYDSLYRLQGSTGGLNGMKNYSYCLDMAYEANGRILRKSQLARTFTSTSSDTLMNYAHLYNYGTAPVNNRVQSVADTVGGGPAQTFSWDANGNMLTHITSMGTRTHCWDELNRLQGSSDKRHSACHLYDAGGDRFYKFSGTPDIMYVNGQWYTYLNFSDPTLYASPYLVATNKGYTKHYYAESERIASKIGGGGLQNLHAVCDELYTDNTSAGSAHVLPRPYAELPALDFEAKRDSSKMHLKRLAGCIEGEMGEIKENILVVLNQYQTSPHSEDECYWYHPDHLGSASWVSDKAGKGIQHLYYLPWGEELDNQRATDYASRYTFSGKERDEETGYGYFGARYYNSDLSIWLSVDPLADKYPGLSPYTYCANNPVKLVDPDGRDIWEFDDSGNLTKVGESDFDEFHKVDYYGNRTGESLLFDRKVVLDDFCIDGKHSSSYYIEVENADDAFKIFSYMAECALNRGGEFAFAVTEDNRGIVGGDLGAIIGQSYAMGNLLTHNKRGYVFTEAWHNHYDNGCPSQYEPGLDDINLASKYPGISFYILTQRGSIFYDGNTPPAKLCPEERRNLLDLDGFEITAPDPRKH